MPNWPNGRVIRRATKSSFKLMLSYAVVTPARNEAENLDRLARSLNAQTVRPSAWVIVDDGSTDDTPRLASDLAREHPWITVLRSPGALAREEPLAAGRRGGRDVVAFAAGLAQLAEPPDVVVKVDADVSMGPDYFARLLIEFENDPSLGIASGACYEKEDGDWRERHVARSHVRGASRAYRWRCLEDVLPLEVRLGWDGIDELKARAKGWRTKSFRELPFHHHRKVGARDGAWRSWVDQGEVAHYMGYTLPYLLVKTLYWMTREPTALGLAWGYGVALFQRKPRNLDPSSRAHLRREQDLRALPARVREALGKGRS